MTTRRWYSRDAQLLRLRTGARDPAVAISTLAENLLDEVGFDGPPFRPDILASFRGISDIRRHPMASAARLVPGDRGLIVEVNVDHSPSKQNFSIDHEITHTLLPTYSGQSVEDVVTGQFSLTSEEELLCDIGASTLLLDGRWLCPLARDAGPSLDTLFQLAETFGASLQATALKLAELNIWPCAFVMWEEGYRKNERVSEQQIALPGFHRAEGPAPKLRVATPYVSASFGRYIPMNKSADRASLVHACVESNAITRGVEVFDLGARSASFYCENIHAPYTSGGLTRLRVISLLLPDNWQSLTPSPASTIQYRLEVF